MLSPETVAVGLGATRIGGKRAITYPLNTVYTTIEQESHAKL